MARPKGKLFALLAIFMAIGIVTATGAFTSVQAERTVTATVDSDANALVGLTPYNGVNGYNGGTAGSSNGYADIKNGVLEINLGGGYSGGTAQSFDLNYNATTEYDAVFNITNNGANSFDYYITRNNADPGAPNAVVFLEGADVTTGTNRMGSGNSTTLASGSTHTISVKVDLTGVDSGDVTAGSALLDGITIHAG